jgi:SAM-dependent methyltransferase
LSIVLDVTGERLVPDVQRGELVHAEHLARYRLAAQLAGGANVLDAACGEGYGSAMLAAGGAASVVGVDVDERAVSHARDKYGLEFVEADVCELPFADDSFDLVASFETIEHVQDAGKMVSELRRVLRPEGRLVISTPNSDEYLIGTEFHTRELAPSEFVELLAGHFDVQLLLYQQNWLLSAVLDERQSELDDGERPLEAELAKVAGHGPGGELYTVAVCGAPLERPLRQLGVVTAVYEAHKLAWRVEETERHLHAWIERANEAERLVTAWNERATEAERQLAQKMEKLERIEGSVSWRVTKPLRSAMQAVRRNRD